MTVVRNPWSVVKVLQRLALCAMLLALCFVGALLFAVCSVTGAQQAAKIPRIGVLWGSTPEAEKDRLAAFQHGLRGLGYLEGENILVEYRYAQGKLDKIPELLGELMELKVEVLVVAPLTAIRAAKKATKTIPIVIVTSVDPVASGIVDSLARPGGNITGLTRLGRDLSGKRLELLKEVLSEISHVGVLWRPGREATAISLREYETAARALKIELQSLEVRGSAPDFEGVMQAASKARLGALIVITEPVIRRYAKRLADLAIKSRLPSMCEASEYVEAGCLMSYMTSDSENFRRAATYVDKILKGAKPADLPVEQPTKFELVINLKTAKQIGLTIPPNVLARADKVIK
jgi:putative ABC transport system substrate-binding protein